VVIFALRARFASEDSLETQRVYALTFEEELVQRSEVSLPGVIGLFVSDNSVFSSHLVEYKHVTRRNPFRPVHAAQSQSRLTEGASGWQNAAKAGGRRRLA